ncbi:ArsR/SmtB family transcription factor [Streptomyces luteireticuli]|uniref:ArsR/SmtB family transcription factor n=1 Tax=Streptomyces luteireticuli TaxID=173858 RepID=UPI0031E14440
MSVQTELAFSADDLALTRFAVSPMWEVVTSFRLLASGIAHPVHRRWLEQVRPRVAEAGLDAGLLAGVIPADGYLCDFLTPFPEEPSPSLEDELDAIRATPEAMVAADLGKLGRRVPDSGRGRWLDLVAEEIETYWEIALAPYWAKIRTVLDAEVFHRARQVAERGAGHLFNDLHGTVSWDDSTLRLVRRRCVVSRDGGVGSGLLLVPSVFASCVLTWKQPPAPPQLAYPARGAGALWERQPVPQEAAIAAVLGRSRTRLLTELDAPASTTELAGRTGISAAGVSQHLAALRGAGMVSAHRAGRSVLYARTAVAESLLAAAA